MRTAPGPWIAVGAIGFVSAIIADSMLVLATSHGYLQGEVDLAHIFRAGARRMFAVAVATFIRYLMVAAIVIVASVLLAVVLVADLQSGVANVRLAILVVTPIVLLLAAYPLLRSFSATAIVMLEGSSDYQRNIGCSSARRSYTVDLRNIVHDPIYPRACCASRTSSYATLRKLGGRVLLLFHIRMLAAIVDVR